MRPFTMVAAGMLAMMLAMPFKVMADEDGWKIPWKVENLKTGEIVHYRFYNKDKKLVSPPEGEVYVIRPGQTKRHNLSCEPLDVICFGGWVKGHKDGDIWGMGDHPDNGCSGGDDTQCCTACGTLTTTVIRLFVPEEKAE